MALTDDERRRLAALEEELLRDDPGLGHTVDRLGRRLPGDPRWFQRRWTLLAGAAVVSVALLTVTVAGAIPPVRTFAILLNLYVVLLAALLWAAQRGGHRR